MWIFSFGYFKRARLVTETQGLMMPEGREEELKWRQRRHEIIRNLVAVLIILDSALLAITNKTTITRDIQGCDESLYPKLCIASWCAKAIDLAIVLVSFVLFTMALRKINRVVK